MQRDHPRTHNGDFANPPPALASLCSAPRWVAWRWQHNGRHWTKPPFRAADPNRHAANDDPQTWSSRPAAVAAVLAGKANGIGFVLTRTEIAAIDLDRCRDAETGHIDAWAEAILDAAPDTYREITVSGEGLRIIGVATGPETHRRFSIDGRERAGVEVYRSATRYITISGLEIGNCSKLANIDRLIDDIVARHNGTANKQEEHGAGVGGNGSDDIDELVKNGAPAGQRSECFARVVWAATRIATRRRRIRPNWAGREGSL